VHRIAYQTGILCGFRPRCGEHQPVFQRELSGVAEVLVAQRREVVLGRVEMFSVVQVFGEALKAVRRLSKRRDSSV
jgi:hypothetical protein